MSQVSLDIIKYKTIQPLARAVVYVAAFIVLKYVLKTQDIVNGEWPPFLMLFVVWFSVEFAMQSESVEYYVLPEYEGRIRQAIESEGMTLKSRDDHRSLYHKPNRFYRPQFVVITKKETYFKVKGSLDFSPKLEPLISDDMLYGKRKRLVFSRPNPHK